MRAVFAALFLILYFLSGGRGQYRGVEPSFPPEVEEQRGPQNYPDDELRRAHHGYYGQISEVDHHVGRLLAALDELAIADDTVVSFTSDHGEWLGEHLRYGKGYPAYASDLSASRHELGRKKKTRPSKASK